MTENSYSFVDEAPLPTAYYRLLQTDISGISSYSKTLSLKRATKLDAVKIYPNPMHQDLYITHIEATDVIEIYNLLGQVWLTKTGQDAVVPLSIAHLPNGVYFVSVKNQSRTVVERIVKQ